MPILDILPRSDIPEAQERVVSHHNAGTDPFGLWRAMDLGRQSRWHSSAVSGDAERRERNRMRKFRRWYESYGYDFSGWPEWSKGEYEP